MGPAGLGRADGSSFSSDPIGRPRRGFRRAGLGRFTLLRAASLRSGNGPIPTLSVRLCAGWAGLGRADCSSHLSGQPKCDSLSTIIHILRSARPSRGRGFPRLFITPLGAVEMWLPLSYNPLFCPRPGPRAAPGFPNCSSHLAGVLGAIVHHTSRGGRIVTPSQL